MQDCSGHDGNPMIHTRHFAKENSDSRLYCVVRKNPEPIPAKNIETANISHEAERNPIQFDVSINKIDTKKGRFRPIMSASCPAITCPANCPAIKMELIVLGMKSFSHNNPN